MGCLLAILALQLAPAKVSAFYWWNGGIHYTGAFSFLLLFMAFLIHEIVRKEKRVLYSVLAAWIAVMVGGGNLVTALIGNVVTGSVKVSGASRRSDAGCILYQCSGSRKLDQAGKIR